MHIEPIWQHHHVIRISLRAAYPVCFVRRLADSDRNLLRSNGPAKRFSQTRFVLNRAVIAAQSPAGSPGLEAHPAIRANHRVLEKVGVIAPRKVVAEMRSAALRAGHGRDEDGASHATQRLRFTEAAA
jgi:hypothetical protein